MITLFLTTASRSFQKSPYLTVLNIATLALGLICFATMYAIALYWENSESHFRNSDRTYVITTDVTASDGTVDTGRLPTTPEHYAKYLKADFPELETIARAGYREETRVSTGERSIRLERIFADPQFLQIFDFEFIHGDSQNALSRPDSAVLTRAAAMQLFGSDNPLGQTLMLDDEYSVTVTGLINPAPEPSHMSDSRSAPMRFELLVSWDVWETINADPDATNTDTPDWWLGANWWSTYVLFPQNGTITLDTFRNRLATFASRHMPPEQLEFATVEVGAIPIRDLTVASLGVTLLGQASSVVSITSLLLGAAVLILLIACVNYANLSIARATAFAREVGIRKAVGADRSQIAGQFLTEAGVFAFIAFLGAIACLPFARKVLKNSADIDLATSVLPSMTFWLGLVITVVVVALIAGSYAAFVLSRIRTVDVLRRGQVRIGPRGLAKWLIGIQYAVASFMLIIVLVFTQQSEELRHQGTNRVDDELIVLDNSHYEHRISSEVLRTELARIADVRGVTGVATIPWSTETGAMVLSRSPDAAEEQVSGFQNIVETGFFAVLDIPVIAGRVFSVEHGDDAFTGAVDPNLPINVVIDRNLLKELGYGSPESAVDEIVYYPENIMRLFGEAAQPIRIIGVVESQTLHIAGNGANSSYYLLGSDSDYQIIRWASSGSLAAVDDIWQRLVPGRPIRRWSMSDLFRDSYRSYSAANRVFVGASLFALLISLFSLIGMATLIANRRRYEIGVRKTLGATSNQILMQLLREFAKPVIIANIVAWPFAYVCALLYLRMFVHRIDLTLIPFVASLVVLLLLSLFAVGVQAFAASKIAPARILRAE